MLFLISYDVVDDDRRGRLHKLLKGYGRRVQYSVFECELGEAEAEDLAGRIRGVLEETADSCRLYRVCEACREKAGVIGVGDLYREVEVVVV